MSPTIHVGGGKGSAGWEGFTEPQPILMLTPGTHCRLSGLENRNEFAIILLLLLLSPAQEKYCLTAAP